MDQLKNRPESRAVFTSLLKDDFLEFKHCLSILQNSFE